MVIKPGGAPLHLADGVREFARVSPGRTAVVDGDRHLTFGALDDRANRLANAVLEAGLNSPGRCAILLGNRLEYPEVAAGLAKAGIPMVPLNPRLSAPEARYILEHSESGGLIVDGALADTVGDAVDDLDINWVLSIGDAPLGLPYEDTLEAAVGRDPHLELDELDPFVVAYTSGTTGKPKGVEISHRSRCLTFYATALEWGLGPGRRSLAVAPMYHGAGFAFGYAPIYTGGTTSMLRAWDPERFLDMVEEDRPHSVFLVPTHAQMLRSLDDTKLQSRDTSSLEVLYFNAAPMPQALKEWVIDVLPDVDLHELYGSTEAGIVSDLRPEDQLRKPGSVGHPWFMTDVQLREIDDRDAVLEDEATGVLYSRSPYLMNGYLKDEDATREVTTDDGFLTAGDVAYRDDEGYLHIVDRVKDVIISGGTNVYPREVEEILHHAAGVADVAVIGVEDETWGERVTAIVVPEASVDLSAEELESVCRADLAGFKVPRQFEFVDALPRNASGKILKRELRQHYGSTT